MAPNPHTLVSSGVEPVDKLLGGLKPGSLYLVHGEPTDTSVFAIKFIIEGLRRGEMSALVMSYSPEEAIHRFGQMGYDCLEDVYAGRLVILEYTRETISQIAAVPDFGLVLRELEWLLGETKARYIVFDPITTVLARRDEDLATSARQFAEWAARLDATVVMTALSADHAILDRLRSLVADSFCFESREIDGTGVRVMVFEKSTVPAQPVAVDQTRGIFLESGTSACQQESLPELPPLLELEAVDQGPLVSLVAEAGEGLIEKDSRSHEIICQPEMTSTITPSISVPVPTTLKGTRDALRDWLAGPELEDSVPGVHSREAYSTSSGQIESRSPETEPTRRTPTSHNRAADARIDAASTQRRVESLLNPPSISADRAAARQAQDQRLGDRRSTVEPEGPVDVLVVNDDEQSCSVISHALAGYSLQFVHDGVSALARLISHRPDLVVLDVDLPVIDGFKVLEHIRSSLSVPIIVVSGSRVRSSDRVLASELGADCFLTKPLSANELSHRAELLIARHRGTGVRERSAEPHAAVHNRESVAEPAEDARFTRYEEFATEVERRVQAAMAGGAPFSVVGCRLPAMTAGGGRVALQLFEIVRELARDTDLTTTNTRNDLVMLLPEATATGARAFAARLRTRVVEQTSEEPTFWIRSFPESALAAHASGGAVAPQEIKHLRRASDHKSPEGGPDRSPDESSRSSAAGAGILP